MSSELRPDDAKRVRDFLNHPAFEDMPHNCQTKAILASEAFDRLMAATAQHPAVEALKEAYSSYVDNCGRPPNDRNKNHWTVKAEKALALAEAEMKETL